MELYLPSCQIICPGRSGTWAFGPVVWPIAQQAPEKTSWRKVCWQCRSWTSSLAEDGELPRELILACLLHQEVQRCKWCEIPAIPAACVAMPQCPSNRLLGTRVKRKPSSWCVTPAMGFSFLNFSLFVLDSSLPKAPATPSFFIYAVAFITSFPFSASHQFAIVIIIFNFWSLQTPFCIFSDSCRFCQISSWIMLPSRTGLLLSLVLFHWIFSLL